MLQQLDELNGYRFDRYKQLCDSASHSGRHRVLMVTTITICSLRTVRVCCWPAVIFCNVLRVFRHLRSKRSAVVQS